MSLDLLTAISPVDGRYREKTASLADYFSEYALIRYRVRVEVEYFIALCEIPLPQLASVNPAIFARLRDIYLRFDEKQARRVKDIEAITNHDVKAVEYFLKEEFGIKNDEEFEMAINTSIGVDLGLFTQLYKDVIKEERT